MNNKIGMKWVFALSLLLVAGLPALAKDKKPKTKRPDYGRIEVTSKTPDAPVRVNGVERGRTGPNALQIDLPPGSYDVEVEFSPTKIYRQTVIVEAGRRNCLCLNYVKTTRVLPCPYTVEVSAPSVVNDGDLITFVSDVNYNGPGVLSYAWSVVPAAATIVRGAGTNTITVDSTGLGGQTVTATLVAEDGSGDPRCRQMAQANVPVTRRIIEKPTPRKTEFGVTNFDGIKARLDDYVRELQAEPNSAGYVFFYGGRTSAEGTADKLAQRARNYLVQLGVDPARLVVANGGYRENEWCELWVVPPGADLPQPSPSLAPSEVRPSRPKATRPRVTPKPRRSQPKPVLKKKRARAVVGSEE